MKAVVNAGPLIALGKLGLVRLLSQLYDVVLIPPIVHEEVVSRGVELGEPDAYVVQMAVLRNEITVSDVIPAYLEKTPGPPRLHVGEQHAIALAL
ncbi:MAG: hypothetical protein GXP42_06635 [Chloroflexi bacterium]|nr:hypothetical protein [Chloroflexota bacterium]